MERAIIQGPEPGYNFKLKVYEGPLDKLLDLIRENGVSIYDVCIAEITEQYLGWLNDLQADDLEDLTEFHSMAAMLLLIKSRALYYSVAPVEMEDDEELYDPRQELVERLIEYQKLKILTGLMEEKERETEFLIERRDFQYNLPFEEDDIWVKADISKLKEIFEKLLKKLPGESIIDLFEEVTINEKTVLMWELLETRGECSLTDLIIRYKSKMDIICAFLAILEAVKIHTIIILQNRIFGNIIIRPFDGVFNG